MRTNLLLATLLTATTALTSASVSAQSSSNQIPGPPSAHSPPHGTQPERESSLSPLLGAPQDDEDSDPSASGAANATDIVDPTRRGASLGGSQTRNAKPRAGLVVSPLLGAPQDYEDSYISGIGGKRGEQTGDDQVMGYRLTPTEKLVSSEFTDSTLTPSGTTPPGDKSRTPAVGKLPTTRGVVPVAANSRSPAASPFDVNINSTDARTASAIYRSPW